MSSLSKQIEQYIKELMAQQEADVLEIQRSLLSEHFHCVPSQINYVLSTRFTPAHGYMVESRRGGGGYVRIVSLPLEDDDGLQQLVQETVGESIGESQSEGLLRYLQQQGLLTERETTLLSGLLKDRVLSTPKRGNKDDMRAHLLQHIIGMMSRDDF